MGAGGAADRFWDEFRGLYEAAGKPTLAKLVDLGKQQSPPTRVGDSALSEWLTRQSVPSARNARVFLALAAVLQSWAKTRCGYQPRPEGWWQQLLRQAQDERAAARKQGRPRRQVGPSPPLSTAHLRPPAGAVRVRDARLRLLGVHAAIRVDPAAGELPAYVSRDLDSDLRNALTAAADGGGFVLLLGGSSVGKTRSLVEAVRAVLPEWWLVHPIDADAVRTFATAPTPRTVLWLDELQRYLERGGGVPSGVVRTLIVAGIVVVATLWPDEYGARTAPPTPGASDPYANDRELLRLAQVIGVSDAFTRAERRRAEALAADQRIRIALDAPDAGFTQVLAAGPELVRWWEYAPHPYGKALITAALDARRVGAKAPLSREYLAAAAPAYLTSAQLATAPSTWLNDALDYATTPLHGAASAVVPVPASIGQIAGYSVADYLHQHARRVRRVSQLPDLVWQALVDHHDPDDTFDLGHSAELRMRYRYAEAFYRRDRGRGRSTPDRLVIVLAEDGRVDEAVAILRKRADAHAARYKDRAAYTDKYQYLSPLDQRFVEVLVEDGRVDCLREFADGEGGVRGPLADLLVKLGRLDELHQRADAGDRPSAYRLAKLLAGQGDVDGAVAVLGKQANDWTARNQLVTLLTEHGRLDEAIEVLRPYTDPTTSGQLADLLVEQGRVAELRQRADRQFDPFAAERLADVLAQHGEVDELHQRADRGDRAAALRLADLLAGQDRFDAAAAALEKIDDPPAWQEAARVERLADLFTKHGRIDEAIAVLRPLAESEEDRHAAGKLAFLFADQGRVDELRQILPSLKYEPHSVDRAMYRLAKHGWIDELRQLADEGIRQAASKLVDLLVEQDNVDELRQRAANGDTLAAHYLAECHIRHGRIDEGITLLRERVYAGDYGASRRLARVLGEHGRVEDLEDEVAAGTDGAAAELRRLQRTQDTASRLPDAR